jgi:hypothetical protein
MCGHNNLFLIPSICQCSSQSSRRKLEPQSPIKPPARPPVQVTLAQLAARNTASESDVLRREIKAPAQK